MLGTPAAAETRGCAAQTVSGGQPPRVCASRRFAKGPERPKQNRGVQQVSWPRVATCVGFWVPVALRGNADPARDDATEAMSPAHEGAARSAALRQRKGGVCGTVV